MSCEVFKGGIQNYIDFWTKDQKISDERTLIILGSRGVSKTTLVYWFLDRQVLPKSTLALEYTFGRKANNDLAKVNNMMNIGWGLLSLKAQN